MCLKTSKLLSAGSASRPEGRRDTGRGRKFGRAGKVCEGRREYVEDKVDMRQGFLGQQGSEQNQVKDRKYH
jgi:hypothetical protein